MKEFYGKMVVKYDIDGSILQMTMAETVNLTFCANSNSQNKACSQSSLDLEEFLIDFDTDRDILDEVTIATTHTPDAKDIRVPTPG